MLFRTCAAADEDDVDRSPTVPRVHAGGNGGGDR